MNGSQERFLMRSGKTKNKMGARRPEGHITDPEYGNGVDEQKAVENGGVL
jgi:hypothetical protein